ncbi:unnamed protein product [Prorocentrum cordatum]|uniref:Glycosyltransferase 2-like domain-containing protein n=1 Tax=Prorocentrum cordatum TaxID=2364126 RepID=A0ABN9UM19_9DINO|nr:unnamed protein product [Polarella glacialis]
MASERSVLDSCSYDEVCPVHLGNIHERRPAALVARATPLAFFLLVTLLAVALALLSPRLLLILCAAFNLSIGLGMTQSGLMCILGARTLRERLRGESLCREDASEGAAERLVGRPSGVVHLVVIPSYCEEEQLLSLSLEAIAQADGSEAFHVVLAMEERECDGQQKALRLREKFAQRFARVEVTSHPTGLRELHLDGSSDAEVPGKASNLKWAVRQFYEQCQLDGLDAERVLLTVADADAIFHPSYFDQIGCEFETLCGLPNAELHRWTMWQAPQLPFRNFQSAPMVSRVHAYTTSVYEFGGVSGLRYGAGHMVFSTYSLPLLLAVRARAHEGDVVAEDHHCHLRCSFYSIRAALLEASFLGKRGPGVFSPGPGPCASTSSSSSSSSSPPAPGRAGGPGRGGQRPALRLRPLMLPVKATMVVSEQGVLQTWRDRWTQARRHAQGVAELSFALLATWDTARWLPPDAAVASAVLWRALRLVHQMLWSSPTCSSSRRASGSPPGTRVGRQPPGARRTGAWRARQRWASG